MGAACGMAALIVDGDFDIDEFRAEAARRLLPS